METPNKYLVQLEKEFESASAKLLKEVIPILFDNYADQIDKSEPKGGTEYEKQLVKNAIHSIAEQMRAFGRGVSIEDIQALIKNKHS